MSSQWRKLTTYDVFVGNIPKDATEKSLSKLFTSYGEIHCINLKDGSRKDGTKIGFVKYYNEADADEAVKERAGHMWDGLPLHVRRTGEKKETKSDMYNQNDSSKKRKNNDKNFDFRSEHNRETISQDNGPNNAERKEFLAITHIEDCCTFYAQNADRNKELSEITLTINEFCPSAKPNQGKPIQHQTYATVYSQDNTWYRCNILQHITEEKSLVKYIDYGNAEIVENIKIIPIPENIVSLPPLARRYKLNRLSPRKDNTSNSFLEEGIKFLTDLTENKILECKIFKNERTNFIPVEININGINLEDELVRKGYAVRLTKGPVNKNGSDGSQPQMFNFDLNNGKLPHPIRGRSSYNGNSMPLDTFEKLGENHIQPYGDRKGFMDIQFRYEQETAQKEILSLKTQIATYHNKLEQMSEQQAKLDFVGNVNQVCNNLKKVQQCRSQFPTGLDASDELENAAKLLLDDDARLRPQNLLHLPGVKQALNHYHTCQALILECSSSGEELQKLISQRDDAMMGLHEILLAFLNEMKELPLQSRLQELTNVINNLNTTYKSYLSVQTTGSVPLHSILEAYKKWKFENLYRFENARHETDKHHKIFFKKMQELMEALCLKTSTTHDKLSLSVPSDLPTCLQKLNEALQAEIKIGDIEEVQSLAVISMLVKKLQTELTQECDYMEQLKQLEVEYCDLEASLRPWLEKKPELTDLLTIRKTIKYLRSRLRHKLADLNDLEEDNDVAEIIVDTIKSELSEIRKELQDSFAKEDKLMAMLSNVCHVHFPEMAIQYPELVTEVKYNGFVKQGRELIQFDLEPISSNNSLWKTKLCGKDIVIKEYLLDSSMNKEVFVNKVQTYSSSKCPHLTPISGIFFSKTEREAYVQIPLCVNLLTMMSESNWPLEKKVKITLDVAEALKTLHEMNLVHGKLNPSSVLFTTENIPTLIPHSFNSTHIVVEKDDKVFKGISFVAPELRCHSKEPSPSSDMFSYGCLLLWLLYPNKEFSKKQTNVPDLAALKSISILPLLQSLLSENSHNRPKADHILQSSDIFYSIERDISESNSPLTMPEIYADFNSLKNEQKLLTVWNVNEIFESNILTEKMNSTLSQAEDQKDDNSDLIETLVVVDEFNICKDESEN